MPLTPPSPNGKHWLLAGGLVLLGGGGLVLLFMGGAGFVLLLVAALYSDNKAPADQLTIVQGTVTNAETGRPVPGMQVAVRGHSSQAQWDAPLAADSGRTDARGTYRLRFRNQPGLYYRVCVDYPKTGATFTPARYWFANPDDSVHERDLTLGRLNTCNFRPGELHTIAVRVHNRRTGYQFLQLPDGDELPLSNRDTTLHLTYYALPAAGIKLSYLRHAGGEAAGDTAVALVLQNPAARFPDTVQATLTFVR